MLTPTRSRSWVLVFWAGVVVVALLLLGVSSLLVYPAVVGMVAVCAVVLTRRQLASAGVRIAHRDVDRTDLVVVLVLYIAIVGLFKLAFGVFGVGHVAGLFLSFGGGMTLGVAVPVAYTVLVRHRPLTSIGLGTHNLKPTAVLALAFGGTQFALTMWGYDLPAPVDWIPLAVMSLTVGLFESIFFRGFVQGRLEDSFGAAPAVFGAAFLYSVYHVGYGMGPGEMLFLFGLGITYAIAYRTTSNILVLWPLLLPVGSLFNNLESMDIDLPWASILGFVDVIGLMVASVVVVRKIDGRRKKRSAEVAATRSVEVPHAA